MTTLEPASSRASVRPRALWRKPTILWLLGPRSYAWAYGLGLVFVVLTLVLRMSLREQVESASLIFFVPAILLTASVGGFGAGMFATLLACALSAYFVLPPLGSFRIESPFAAMTMTVLAVTGMFIAAVCELLRKTIRAGDAANVELAEAYRSADRLAAIVEGSSDAIVGKTLNGVISSWNTASVATFGYSAAEAIGSNVAMLIPAHLVAEEEAVLADVAMGRTVRPFETVRRHKDGTIIDVSVTVSPVRDAEGAVIGASTTMRDISERKRAEEALRSNQATLAAALSSMTDAVFITDAAGTILHVNEAFARLHQFADAKHCLSSLNEYPALFELVAAGGTVLHFEDWPAARALRGETGAAEIRIQRKDSGRTWLASVNYAPILDQDHNILGVVVNERDITDEREAEGRFQAMRNDLFQVGRLNELGHVSAGIAHELNQPLAAMLNYSNAARRLSADPASFDKALAAIGKATDQAARAGQILLRMRTLVEKWQSNRRTEDLNAIIQETVALETAGGPPAGVTIHLDLAAMLPPVLADRPQIQHVLVNLLRNAFDAMRDVERRELIITSAVVDNGVEVAVADTGLGIPQEIADRLFMPFFTTKSGGMGIGLVISQSIIEAHGGHISVKPNEGGGTRFLFRLPAVAGTS